MTDETIIGEEMKPDELRQKLRMIISHASGGHLSKPEDVNRSTNDICVEISRHNNRIWEYAQKSALKGRSPEVVTGMREALKNTITAWEALPGNRHYSVADVQAWISGVMKPAIDEARAALSKVIVV